MSSSDPTPRRVGPVARRIAAAAAIAVGVLMLVLPVALALFDRTPAAQRLTDRIRPAIAFTALQRRAGELDTARAALQELRDRALPALAPQLGETPEQLNASIETEDPDVAAGFRALPDIAKQVGGALTLFQKDRGAFHAADSIPTTSLSFTVGPWLMMASGVVLVAVGVVVWRVDRPGPLLAVGALGLVLVVGPLAVAFPQKTAQAASLVDDLRPLVTRPTADAVKGWQRTMDRMNAQLQGRLMPSLAARLGATPQQLDAALAVPYPAVANLSRVGAILADFADNTRRLDASVDDYAKTKRIPYRALPWLFIVPGAALAVAAGWALAANSSWVPAIARPATPAAD